MEFNYDEATQETLAAIVVSYKLLGLNKKLAENCMKELAKRRENGNNFNYEKYIEEKLKEITPEKGPNVNDLGQAIKLMKMYGEKK